MKSRRPILARAGRLAALLIAIVWLAAGGAKLLALSTFEEVLHNHRVLSEPLIELAWMLPAVEVVLGLLVLASCAAPLERRTALRRLVGIASAGLLLVLSGYILLVPEEVFRTVGCGCQVAGLDLLESPSRAGAVGINVLLVLAHFGLWMRF